MMAAEIESNRPLVPIEPKPKKSSRARVIIDWIVGLSLLVLGIVGLFLPVLQGLLFIGLGLVVLSKHSRLARAGLDRLKKAGHDFKDRVRRKGKGTESVDER